MSNKDILFWLWLAIMALALITYHDMTVGW
jgi:hypothetical protein